MSLTDGLSKVMTCNNPVLEVCLFCKIWNLLSNKSIDNSLMFHVNFSSLIHHHVVGQTYLGSYYQRTDIFSEKEIKKETKKAIFFSRLLLKG